MTGRTASTDFPVLNAYQSVKPSNQDVIVVQINPTVTGSTSLRYSTYLGGSSDEEGTGIAVTSSNVAVVVGFSTSNNFPVLNPYQNTRQGDKEGVLTRINPALSGPASLLASTYLGGSDAERDLSVVIDSSGAAVLSGYTRSANFPTVGAVQATLGGGTNPITRRQAVTVRLPGARMAPTKRILTHSQIRSLNSSSKCRSTCIICGGRFRMASPFLGGLGETSVPCLPHFVEQMDKVELT